MTQYLENNNLPVYTIGVAANLIGVSVHALRMYESAGNICKDVTCRNCNVYLSVADCKKIKELTQQIYE